MSEFLKEGEIFEKLRYLMEGDDKRIASAFWSKTWIKQSGINFEGARVILDVSMGMTSPKAINKLLKSKAKVGHCLQLHTKIYLSDRGAIVGSSNASLNGLGTDEISPKHREASIFVAPDTETYSDIEDYFEALSERGSDVNDALRLAKRLFKKGRYVKDVSEEFNAESLLQTLMVDPERFHGLGFVFCGSLSTDDNEKKKLDLKLAQETNPEITYEQIDRSTLFDCWSVGAVKEWPHTFVEYYIIENMHLEVYAYEVVSKNAKLQKNKGRVRAKKTWKEVVTNPHSFIQSRVKAVDADLAVKLWKDIKSKGKLFRTPLELSERLRKLAGSTQEQSLEPHLNLSYTRERR